MRIASSCFLVLLLLGVGCGGDPPDDEPCAAGLAPGAELQITTNRPDALTVTLEGQPVSCTARSGELSCRADPRGAREHVFRVTGPGVDEEVTVEVTEQSAHPGFPDDRPECQRTVLYGFTTVSIEVPTGDAGAGDASTLPTDDAG